MVLQTSPSSSTSVIETIVAEFLGNIIATLPKVLSGVVFLTLAFFSIRLIISALRRILTRVYPKDQRLIVNLLVTAVTVFLWFGTGLVLLKIVGMDEVAASLGTATGFIGLGIAFALKDMIADTVAGVYLLRDPHFNEGDFVDTASVTGTVTGIDLRKTRIRTGDGDLVVVANRDVEKKWTVETTEGSGQAAAPNGNG